MIRIASLIAYCALASCTVTFGGQAAPGSIESCGTEVTPFERIRAAKDSKFESLRPADHNAVANALLNCIGHPDPDVRDGVVYETLAYMLRANWLEAAQIKALRSRLLGILNETGPRDFAASNAALLLSEIARAERISPFLSDRERAESVAQASNYLSSVSDYRGFSDREGWRHGVAHGADWLMQLSVNPKLSRKDSVRIRDAVASQVIPQDHSYIFGEPERLARPIIFLAASGRFTKEEWTLWLMGFVDPMPLTSWDEAYESEAGLARLHNLRAFLNALYVSASRSQNPGVKDLLPGLNNALNALPA